MAPPDGYVHLRTGAGLIDRSAGRGRLLLSGQDRRGYLQGLLTNDILALGPGRGCYAAYLTPQGRMIADMRLFELGDSLLVDLDRSVTAGVLDRWEMFVFNEDVRIEDRTAATAQLGIYGPAAAGVVSAALDAVEGDEGAAASDRLGALPLLASLEGAFDGASVRILRGDDPGVPGFDVVLPAGAAPAFSGRLRRAGAGEVSAEAAEVCRIEAGRPRFGIDMTTETIPLEAGIEDRAISQTKGCYVGQEVIIRVLHRGHGRVAKRLTGLALAGTAVPEPGAVVRSGDREIGVVTSAALSPTLGHAIALGYVHRDYVSAGTAVSVDGAPAVVAALPFV